VVDGDLQYISIQQYIDTINEYDTPSKGSRNLKYSNRTVTDCFIRVLYISDTVRQRPLTLMYKLHSQNISRFIIVKRLALLVSTNHDHSL